MTSWLFFDNFNSMVLLSFICFLENLEDYAISFNLQKRCYITNHSYIKKER